MIKGNLAKRSWALIALIAAATALTGCDNYKKKYELVYAENIELRQRLDASNADLEVCQSDRDNLLAKLSDMEKMQASTVTPAAAANTGFEQIGGISVERGARGEVTVRVPGDVLFASGQVSLKSAAKNTLGQIASVLKSQYTGRTVRVEGYTDTDPIKKSKWKDNEELSTQRALAVERYLASRGVDADRMYSAGFGASKPMSSKAKSRRVEIVVIMN